MEPARLGGKELDFALGVPAEADGPGKGEVDALGAPGLRSETDWGCLAAGIQVTPLQRWVEEELTMRIL